MSTTSDISVIIVTYNSEGAIQPCLDSIISDSTNPEIVVVDNNSQDKTVEVVKKFAPKVQLIENNQNLGFAKAMNMGARYASGKYLVILNPDSKIVTKDCLSIIKDTLEQNQEFGVIGSKLVYPDGSVQKTVRNLPTVWGAIQEFLFRKKGAFDFYQPEGEQLTEVESIVGAFMIIKKELFEGMGGFDEKYFLYFEDLDLCKRLRKAGYKVGYFPKVVVEHQVGASGANMKTIQLSLESSKKYHGVLKDNMIKYIGRLGNFMYGKL